MKKELLMVCAALALVGCDQADRGGMGSDTTVDTSTPSTSTNYDSRTSGRGSSSTLTNTNRSDQLPQGSAPQSSGTQQGSQGSQQQPTPQPQQPQSTP